MDAPDPARLPQVIPQELEHGGEPLVLLRQVGKLVQGRRAPIIDGPPVPV